jgi:hypothetical protein
VKRIVVIASLIAVAVSCSSSTPPASAQSSACSRIRKINAQIRSGDISKAEGRKTYLAIVADAKRSDNADMRKSATKLERFIGLMAAGKQYLTEASTPEELTESIAEQAGKEMIKMANICGIAFGSPTPST